MTAGTAGMPILRPDLLTSYISNQLCIVCCISKACVLGQGLVVSVVRLIRLRFGLISYFLAESRSSLKNACLRASSAVKRRFGDNSSTLCSKSSISGGTLLPIC